MKITDKKINTPGGVFSGYKPSPTQAPAECLPFVADEAPHRSDAFFLCIIHLTKCSPAWYKDRLSKSARGMAQRAEGDGKVPFLFFTLCPMLYALCKKDPQ
jgi:hypothetical protein